MFAGAFIAEELARRLVPALSLAGNTLFAIALLACGERTTPVAIVPIASVAASAPVVVPSPSAPSAAAPTQACPLVPIDLVAVAAHGSPTMLSVDAKGNVTQSISGQPKPFARLDPRGCLVSSDGVEVDVTRSGALWTRHERFDFSKGTLRLESRRSVSITEGGDVVFFNADGSPDPMAQGGFAFKGYAPSAACAARVLFVTFMIMMPSMAVSDGHPRVLPPPDDSACAELHRGK